MKTAAFSLIVLASCVLGGSALSCLACDRTKCPRVKCKGDHVGTDICGCCPRCLKVEGEPCGGIWNFLGACAPGLTCQMEPLGDYDFFKHVSTQGNGVCVEEEDDPTPTYRERRSPGHRRLGASLIKPTKHRHQISGGGIPPSVLALLRKRGYSF